MIDIPDRSVAQIKESVDSGSYDDAQEFVVTAIQNQLQLEGQTNDRPLTLDEAVKKHGEDYPTEEEGVKPSRQVPAADGLGRTQYESISTVSPPDPVRLDDGPLWGQYNRIFPVKLVVRRLANEVAQHSEAVSGHGSGLSWVDLGQFRNTTSQVARNFGLNVKDHDKERSRSRGERLAAGLPTGEDPEKSTDRFETHFVGYSDRNDNLTGAPAHLHFVDVTPEEPSKIGITQAGLQFAQLYNPLLDDHPGAERALSDDECEFYLEHVREKLPDEYRAIVRSAEAIASDADRPTSLTKCVGDWEWDWSESQANTVRTGLVSRMHELGLVEREQVGRSGIEYSLTAEGQAFLEDSDPEVAA